MYAIITTPGSHEPISLVSDQPEPHAAAHEAVIAVQAFSLNRGELALIAGRPAGWRPGQDIAGTVLRPALDGSGPAAGARVAALVDEGGWAERVAVATDRLAVVPDAVTTTAAATLGIAGRTALHGVEAGGSLLGRHVLITGASGGVGRFAVQLAARAGAEIVAVSRGADAQQALLALGARSVVASVSDAGSGFDLVLDCVGGKQLELAIRAVAPGGTVVLIGAVETAPAELRLTDFFGHENASIRTFFSYAQASPIDQDLRLLLRMLADGSLHSEIGVERSWRELAETLEDLRAGRVGGKAVLLVD